LSLHDNHKVATFCLQAGLASSKNIPPIRRSSSLLVSDISTRMLSFCPVARARVCGGLGGGVVHIHFVFQFSHKNQSHGFKFGNRGRHGPFYSQHVHRTPDFSLSLTGYALCCVVLHEIPVSLLFVEERNH
jgi:hypothetical protein